jgi:hypothetical protein
MLWKRLPKYFFMVIFFGDPNTVLVMTRGTFQRAF